MSKLAKMFFGGCSVGCGCLGFRVKIANASIFAINPNHCLESTTTRFTDAFDVFPISVVLGATSFAQIFKTIIASVTINVVNLIFWPMPGNIQPNKTMGRKAMSTDSNLNVPISKVATSNITGFNFCTRFDTPAKVSFFISKEFSNPFGCKAFFKIYWLHLCHRKED